MENRRVRNRTGIFECGSELPTLSTRRMVHRNRTGARPRRSCCPLELLNHTSRQASVKLNFEFLSTLLAPPIDDRVGFQQADAL